MKFKNHEEIAKKYEMGGGWMSLEEGDNQIRLVSEFEDYGTHFDQIKKRSVICIGKEHCEYCIKGDKPKVQFIGWVIDRKDQQIKLLRIGYKIFTQIGELSKSKEYAFEILPSYDITIRRKGQKLDTTYTVIPARQDIELTEDEKNRILEEIKQPKEIIDQMKAKIAITPEDTEEFGPENEEEL